MFKLTKDIISVWKTFLTSIVPYGMPDKTLRWRHNDPDGVSNHQPHDCFLNRLLRRRRKKTSKLRVTGLGAGNSPMTGEFPAQMASNAENGSIWWRHRETSSIGVVEANACACTCNLTLMNIRTSTSTHAFTNELLLLTYQFQIKFHWSLFLRAQLTIFQHWFR